MLEKNKLAGRTTLFIVALMIVYNPVYSQIPPPDLYCIKNDTLLWTKPLVTCGNITAYNIFYADNPVGPFTLLNKINNTNQTNFFHNTSGKNFYYYMTTEADCTGQLSGSSDTLDNLDPPLIPIEAVSVTGGKCSISWNVPAINKQLSYIIYRSTSQGTIPIDTVFNQNSYLDQGSNPQLKSEIYYVLGLDACGNASLFDEPHYSIYSNFSIDSCERILKLKWSAYQNWKNGVKEYQIWVGKNGSTASPIDTVPSTQLNYEFKDINDGDDLCIFVKAIENVSGISSVSNENCLKIKIIQPIKWLHPYAASILPDNSIDLKWNWNSDAEIKTAQIFTGYNSSNINEPTAYQFQTPPQADNTFNMMGKNPSIAPIFYNISVTDLCNITTKSSVISSIFLRGKANTDKTNTLTWEFPSQGDALVKSYDLHKIINGIDYLAGIISKDILSLTDIININNPDEEKVCYYVNANVEAPISGANAVDAVITSNTVCINQYATMFFPNALVPDGLNNEFKPVTIFAQNADYLLIIYDRWGQKVFETSDINLGWRGKKSNQSLPAGMYTYYARLKQPNGNLEESKGTVMLVR